VNLREFDLRVQLKPVADGAADSDPVTAEPDAAIRDFDLVSGEIECAASAEWLIIDAASQ